MYVGEEYNANTGLYYLRARYMNPTTGSFTTMDSYQGNLYDPISLHKYAYANANPVSYTDPSGYFSLSECAVVQAINSNIDKIVHLQTLKRVMNWANAACMTYDILSATMAVLLDEAEIGYVIWSVVKGLTIALLINCLLASTSSLVLKAIFATKEIKDQKELIDDAIKSGNPWLVALRVLQLFTIIFAIGAQCFTGETLVATADGLVAIETIEVGDYVLAEDTITGEKEYKRVLKVHVSQTTKLVHVTISDEDSSETDETINTTDNHPFYVEGKGWVAAIELEEGDILRTSDGDIKTVKDVAIEYLDEPELIYNLEVEGYHTYFVSDENVLVHNDCPSATNIKAGKNFKSHFIDHKKLLEEVTGKKYSKYKTHGQEFLDDIGKVIEDGTVKYVGKGTLKKGQPEVNIYRGNGITIVIMDGGEFITLLESGKGLDLAIQISD